MSVSPTKSRFNGRLYRVRSNISSYTFKHTRDGGGIHTPFFEIRLCRRAWFRWFISHNPRVYRVEVRTLTQRAISLESAETAIPFYRIIRLHCLFCRISVSKLVLLLFVSYERPLRRRGCFKTGAKYTCTGFLT